MTTEIAASESRVPLNRDRVLRTAIELADSAGITSLSMRKLGLALGVEAMSLYNHVSNKLDLISGMFDMVMGEIDLPSAGSSSWKAEIRAAAMSAHEVLLRHPWAAGLMMSPGTTSLTRLRWMDAVLGTLRQSGFSAELTHHAWHALDSHIVGFALWIAGLPATGAELREMAATFFEAFPMDELPFLAEHAAYHMRELDPEDEGEFAFGLDLILNGIERLRDAPESV